MRTQNPNACTTAILLDRSQSRTNAFRLLVFACALGGIRSGLVVIASRELKHQRRPVSQTCRLKSYLRHGRRSTALGRSQGRSSQRQERLTTGRKRGAVTCLLARRCFVRTLRGMSRELTQEEAVAIQQLRTALAHWPKSLTLFGRSGTLDVLIGVSYDGTTSSHQERVVATIDGVWADGGDP